jgi:hypothetical protein
MMVDAALRPQDRTHFTIWFLLESVPDLSVRRS